MVKAGGSAAEAAATAVVEPDPVPRVGFIVSIGFPVDQFVPGQGAIASFPHQPQRDDVETLIDVVRAGIDRYGHVVAIYPRWESEPARRRLETVGAAINSFSIATYATALPPLAAAVLAALASASAQLVASSGALVAALPHLERELMIYGWLGSVAGLRQPAPHLFQHLMSYLPGTTFGVSVQPSPAIRRLAKRRKPSLSFATTYRPIRMAAACADDAGEQWIEEVVAPAFRCPPVVRVSPTPFGPKWWGTTKLAEAVVYPVDVPVVARRITKSLHSSLCRWCGEAIATDHCPFCGLERSAGAIP